MRSATAEALRVKRETGSILSRMFILNALLVSASVEHNNHEDHKTEPEENNHSRPIFPDLLDPIRQLGPIHVAE
jgi:hypothetical protein